MDDKALRTALALLKPEDPRSPTLTGLLRKLGANLKRGTDKVDATSVAATATTDAR